jgi:hypothetical protein
MPQSIEMTRQQLYDLVWSEERGRCRGRYSHVSPQPEEALPEASGANSAAWSLEEVFDQASSRQGTAATDHGRTAHLG